MIVTYGVCNFTGDGDISSVFGRTGTVVAQTNDYSFSQISGAAAPSQLPVATTSALGIVEPDNSTITISGGVISAVNNGNGTITPSLRFELPFYSAGGTASTLRGDTAILTDGAGNLSAVSLDAVGSGSVAGVIKSLEGTTPAGITSTDLIWGDSTSHRWKFNANAVAALYFSGISTPGSTASFKS
jgi:hypothetical protein